jgi:phosphoketolase
MHRLFRQFSFLGGVPSHVTPGAAVITGLGMLGTVLGGSSTAVAT